MNRLLMTKISFKKACLIIVGIVGAAYVLLNISTWLSAGKKPPKGSTVSKPMYELGVAAREITDDYLADKTSAETAYLKLVNNCSEQKSLADRKNSSYSHDYDVYYATSELTRKFEDKVEGLGVDDAIRKARDELVNALKGK